MTDFFSFTFILNVFIQSLPYSMFPYIRIFFQYPERAFSFFRGLFNFQSRTHFSRFRALVWDQGAFWSPNFRKIMITLFSIKIVAHFYFYHSGIPSLPITNLFWFLPISPFRDSALLQESQNKENLNPHSLSKSNSW